MQRLAWHLLQGGFAMEKKVITATVNTTRDLEKFLELVQKNKNMGWQLAEPMQKLEVHDSKWIYSQKFIRD